MSIAINFANEGNYDPGPRGLAVFQSAQTDRFGAMYFGSNADKTAAGVWGEKIPFVYLPEKVDKLTTATTNLRRPAPLELDGQAGQLRQPHSGLLVPWSRKRRAVYAEFPDRRYMFRLRWLAHRVVVREGVGQVLHWTGGVFHLHDRADEVDTAVSLLIGWTVSDQYIVMLG